MSTTNIKLQKELSVRKKPYSFYTDEVKTLSTGSLPMVFTKKNYNNEEYVLISARFIMRKGKKYTSCKWANFKQWQKASIFSLPELMRA